MIIKTITIPAFLFINLIVSRYCQVIEIEDGKLNGTTMQTRKGVSISAFLKIPFAEPPVGDLRFQPPIKNKNWEGVLNATVFGPRCMQTGGSGMSEDCLHLNVFTRSLNAGELKPVIVYIHGGGYFAGSSIDFYPDYLLDRDIVLVTINYRLGPFGFLATGTKDAPGNMGLKDQVMALKWVQRNIKFFGGNPELVTITGLSAGGFSVTAHMASEMSKGLFHRAIAMSGSITYQTGLETDNVVLINELAVKLKCPTDEGMLACLRQKPATDIAALSGKDYLGCLSMPWFPVVEHNFGQERFFMDQPNKLFRTGSFIKVPVIIGITADEFISPVSSLLNNKQSVALLNDDFTEVASKCFYFKGNGYKTTEEIAQTFRKHYLPYDKIDKRSFNSLQQLCADGTIGYGVHKFVHYVSSFTDVYYYKFNYIGRYSSFTYPCQMPYGVHHSDDNQYLFASNDPPRIKETDQENFMVERMTRIWEQFAKYGDPNDEKDEYLTEMNWPKHDLENEYYLDIGRDMVEKQGLYLERYSVWDKMEEPKVVKKRKIRKERITVENNIIVKSWKMFANTNVYHFVWKSFF